MLYLLDANVLIDADRDYYPIDSIPEFWSWLLHHAQLGNVKICTENYEEIAEGTGQLPDWLEQEEVKAVLLLNEESDQVVVSKVVDEGYAPDLTDIEIVGSETNEGAAFLSRENLSMIHPWSRALTGFLNTKDVRRPAVRGRGERSSTQN